MFWITLLCFAFVLKVSPAWPISAWPDTALAYDLSSDYMDNFYGPWSPDYLRGGRFMGGAGLRTAWPFDRYGPFDMMESFGPPAFSPDPYPRQMDYMYTSGYPRTTEVAKENYVRDYPYGGTEVGIRDSVSMRNGPWRTSMPRSNPYYQPAFPPRGGFRGMDRLYNPYLSDYDFPMAPFRRPIPPAMSAARPSSLRWGGDVTYLRR